MVLDISLSPRNAAYTLSPCGCRKILVIFHDFLASIIFNGWCRDVLSTSLCNNYVKSLSFLKYFMQLRSFFPRALLSVKDDIHARTAFLSGIFSHLNTSTLRRGSESVLLTEHSGAILAISYLKLIISPICNINPQKSPYQFTINFSYPPSSVGSSNSTPNTNNETN